MSHLGPQDRLSPEALRTAIKAVPAWSPHADEVRIERSFLFQDFAQAFSFMGRAALVAERLDHHPEWCNVWNRVDIKLTTHTAGGITEADIGLAEALDAIAAEYELMCDIRDGACGGCA